MNPLKVYCDTTDCFFCSTNACLFPRLGLFQLPSNLLNRDEKRNKFVNMMVTFGGFHEEERIMMVSFHSGYVFIQTDKPVYNPGDTGEDRVTCRFAGFE